MSDTAAQTPQERVVDEARNVLKRLDEAWNWHHERGNTDVVREIDFCIGATLSLRTTVQKYDKAVGHG